MEVGSALTFGGEVLLQGLELGVVRCDGFTVCNGGFSKSSERLTEVDVISGDIMGTLVASRARRGGFVMEFTSVGEVNFEVGPRFLGLGFLEPSLQSSFKRPVR